MTIKLVALDLDDTLLDPALGISAANLQAIRQVQQMGIMVTISTGRMYRSARPYAVQLGLETPLITYEGAWVKSACSDQVLYSQPVPQELAREVMLFLKDAGVHFHSYYNDCLVMEKVTAEGRAYSQLARVDITVMADLVAGLEHNQAMKIMAISYQESRFQEIEQQLKSLYGSQLHITRSKPHFLEVMHPLADKARALQVTADYLGIQRQEVMAVGDSYNDLEMIAWAGTGVAMGNAYPAVKQQADYITASNQDDGVALALQRFILDGGDSDSDRFDQAG